MFTFTDVVYNGGRLRVRVEGLKEAAQLTNPIATKLQISAAMNAGTDVAFRALIGVTPVKSGDMKKAWRKYAASGDSINIQNNDPGAVYLYFGSRPRIIQATRTNAMALSNRNTAAAGEVPFGPVKWALHPGHQANDAFARSIEKGAGEAAYEVIAGMVTGFYANGGTLQRTITTARGHRFGTRF
jgi:hypothetical protein